MKKLLFLGDSITDAGHLFDDDPLALGHGYVKMIAENFRAGEAALQNKGQDGFTSADILHLLKRDGLPDSADCITLLIGVNDLTVACYANPSWIPCVFRQNICDILTLTRRKYRGRIILMEPFLFIPPDIHRPLLPLLDTEHRILQAAASEFHADYLPLHEKLTLTARKCKSALTTDGIHLTDKGNQILADAWLDMFLHKTENSK